jgi:hypothetical protein
MSEALMAVVYVTLGYTLFRWFEIESKRRGTLEAI